MKIALISDIHANLPALEAVLASIDSRKPDAVYCLGDLVGYNIWPNEVIDLIRERKIPTIAGNHDFDIARLPSSGFEPFMDSSDKNGINRSYSNFLLTRERKDYLRELPEHLRIGLKLNNRHLTILFVHGSPRAINEYLYEEHDEADLLNLMDEYSADVLCFGHTHKQFHRVLTAEGRTDEKHAINLGSVGKPKDGDPRACYVLLTIQPDIITPEKYNIQPEFVRVPYNVEQAAIAVEKSPLPDEFADMLRKAY